MLLEDRLKEWDKLVRKFHELEQKNLEALEYVGNDLVILTCNYEKSAHYLEFIELPTLEFLKRINMQSKMLKEKMDKVLHSNFTIEMQKLRKDTDVEMISKALNLAERYWNERKEPYRDYMFTASSFVTQFLFQPPYVKCENLEERTIFYDAFKGWDPNKYVILFNQKLRGFFNEK